MGIAAPAERPPEGTLNGSWWQCFRCDEIGQGRQSRVDHALLHQVAGDLDVKGLSKRRRDELEDKAATVKWNMTQRARRDRVRQTGAANAEWARRLTSEQRDAIVRRR